MKNLRKNVAIAIDGGGIKGVIPAKALAILDEHLKTKKGKSLNEICRLTAGTSTGSIIAATLAAGIRAEEIHNLYLELGEKVFRRFGRWTRFAFSGYRYSNDKLREELETALDKTIGKDAKMEYFFKTQKPMTDVVLTTFDLLKNNTRFIKPWNRPEKRGDEDFTKWSVVDAVLASSAAPTYLPRVHKHYIDGGVGSYNNPCYLAAYEIYVFLQCAWGWKPEETTLISLGTGEDPPAFTEKDENKRLGIKKLAESIFGAFMQSAAKQQCFLVNSFFEALDFRRFQVNLDKEVSLDDAREIERLSEKYGKKMGKMILEDKYLKIEKIYKGFEVSFKCPR